MRDNFGIARVLILIRACSHTVLTGGAAAGGVTAVRKAAGAERNVDAACFSAAVGNACASDIDAAIGCAIGRTRVISIRIGRHDAGVGATITHDNSAVLFAAVLSSRVRRGIAGTVGL